MHQEPCPNGSVHSFNRRWTSTAEDAFLSLPHPFENLAPGDASPFDPIRTGSPNTQESNWCSSLQTEAQQLDCESLFGLEPESGGKSIFSLGGNIDDGSLIPDAESTVDFNFDPNDGFDHSCQSSLSYSDLVQIRPVMVHQKELLLPRTLPTCLRGFQPRCPRLSFRILPCQTPYLPVRGRILRLPIICSLQMVLNLNVWHYRRLEP